MRSNNFPLIDHESIIQKWANHLKSGYKFFKNFAKFFLIFLIIFLVFSWDLFENYIKIFYKPFIDFPLLSQKSQKFHKNISYTLSKFSQNKDEKFTSFPQNILIF